MAGDDQIIKDLEFGARLLSYMLSSCQVYDDGTVVEIRQQVAKLNGVKISVYSDEHPPPHFHVESSGKSAAFAIDDCARLSGQISRRDERIVNYWFAQHGKKIVVNAWNKTRPGDCSVGTYAP